MATLLLDWMLNSYMYFPPPHHSLTSFSLKALLVPNSYCMLCEYYVLQKDLVDSPLPPHHYVLELRYNKNIIWYIFTKNFTGKTIFPINCIKWDEILYLFNLTFYSIDLWNYIIYYIFDMKQKRALLFAMWAALWFTCLLLQWALDDLCKCVIFVPKSLDWNPIKMCTNIFSPYFCMYNIKY